LRSYDLGARSRHPLEDLFPLRPGATPITDEAIFFQVLAGDVGQAPHRHLTIPMLTDDIGLHVARVYPAMLAQKVRETSAIEDRA